MGLLLVFRYYPRMMAVVATTLRLKDTLNEVGFGEFHLKFWIAGVKYTINLDELASLWGFPNNGIWFKGGSNPPKEFEHWDGEGSLGPLKISRIGGGKYSLPRKGNHGVLTKEDVFILRAMKEETEPNWPYLWAHQLMGSGLHHRRERHHVEKSQQMGRGTVVDRKGKRNKAVVENAPSQPGTSLDSQFTLELLEVFAERMHAVSIDWDKKMEGVDKRLKVIESRIASQAKGLQSLEEGMNAHFSRKAQSGI
ncbi:hypothetical protein PIB30_053271 [Stylosanthes scabra]|uniref:Uncharacterized protein n=1 Tax=Stylosanthes scabra TaxID=79078 RepID=A0ABU6SI93_9FABA|nr:hypothetical protein [Stylosanthes scabra]